MFDYSHLEALLAVEREGSIDAAARSLGVSASAISQRIKVLEERIGAITVNRQKPASPTAFGRNLCRHAQRVILLEQELIEKNVHEFSDMQKGSNVIKVTVDETSITSWFIDVMKSDIMRNNHFLYDVSVENHGTAWN